VNASVGYIARQSIAPVGHDPRAWPECDRCGSPFVLRRMSMLEPAKWSWQRDCKHKTAGVRLAGPDAAEMHP
jgi:hypothetical protein